ncbi:hypothetical protein SLE2022_303130 [Rubroshorea leprosula]
MLLPEPELTEPDLDAAEPIVSLRRCKPAVAVAEPCGGHDARLQALLHNSIRRLKGEMASEERSGGGWRNAVSSPDLGLSQTQIAA